MQDIGQDKSDTGYLCTKGENRLRKNPSRTCTIPISSAKTYKDVDTP